MAGEGSGAVAPAGASLPDRIALGVLTRLVTRELVEDVLAVTDRKEQRKGCSPPGHGLFRARAGAVLRGFV